MMELNWGNYEPSAGRVQRRLRERDEGPARRTEGRRHEGHPGPGPALHPGLGEGPAERQVRRPERRGLHRGELRLQQQHPQGGERLPGPRRRRPGLLQLLVRPGHLRQQQRGHVPLQRHLLGLRRQRPERRGDCRRPWPATRSPAGSPAPPAAPPPSWRSGPTGTSAPWPTPPAGRRAPSGASASTATSRSSPPASASTTASSPPGTPATCRTASSASAPPGASSTRSSPTFPHLVANITSVADGSQGNVGCTAADRTEALDGPNTVWWSSARWISRIADEYGIRKVGENPGYTASNAAFYTDAGPDRNDGHRHDHGHQLRPVRASTGRTTTSSTTAPCRCRR